MRTILLIALATLAVATPASRRKSVYARLASEPQFAAFDAILQNSSAARRAVLRGNATVFAPTNDAFDVFDGYLRPDAVYYHVAPEARALATLAGRVDVLGAAQAPLWIARVGADIYVNDAKIDAARSDYFSRANGAFLNYNQVLHVIDRVLEPPPPTSTGNPPTALDLIDAFADDATLRATKFRDKIAKYKMWDAFNASAPSTFLVPIDAGVAGARQRLLDRYVVDAHVVPDQVLFWRPAAKNFYRETRANGDYVYVLVKFVETDGKRYVRSSTVLGDSDHAKGETQSEIVKANVPVSNGVVHFIKRPIAIIDAKLPLFPNQQIIDKLAADPTLSKTYELGERSGFNRNLRRRKSSLMTYFVPSDVAWSRVATPRGDEARRALARHLVVSDVGFTMKRLMELSKNGNLTMVMMGGDQLDVRVVKENGDYYVIVGRKWVRVARPDYMCQDGVVHVVDEVMVEDAGASLDGRPFALNFWQSVKDVLFG